MAPKVDPALQKRISEAKDLVATAESEIQTALSVIPKDDRSNKTMITEVLRKAFEKLETARRNLEEILEPEG